MAVAALTAEQLQKFIKENHEARYLLLDVRQPGEYRDMHIPGARLMPLPEVAQQVDRLPSDKSLIFYCRSGGRSMAAASLADEEIEDHGPIYNLDGGIMAWNGVMLEEAPRVRLFAGQDFADMLTTAMNLEKGALRFYGHIRDRRGRASWAEVLGHLAKAEKEHAQTVFGFLKKHQPQTDPFETMFDQLKGDVLEGGLTLTQALEVLDRLDEDACLGCLELSLKIEYAAYDLYRSLADQVQDADARQVFLSLAQAEKAHMRLLSVAVEKCP
jgi:rhodanese-related sulfurtransferase/rubrerythrin